MTIYRHLTCDELSLDREIERLAEEGWTVHSVVYTTTRNGADRFMVLLEKPRVTWS